MGQPAGPAGLLNEAAALLVRLQPDDATALARLAGMLEQAGSGGSLPPAAQEPVGRALWRLLDLVEGKAADRSAALTEVGEHLEEALDALDDARPVLAAGVVRSLEDEAGRPRPGELGAPAARAPVAQHGSAASTIPLEAVDAVLLADFVTESGEYLAAAEGSLLALETDAEDHEAINTVFRAFHTIKGTSGFIRIAPITELAHHAESVLSRMRDGEIPCTGEYADVALRAVDVLKELLHAIGHTDVATWLPDGYAELIATLERIGASPRALAAASPTVGPSTPPTASGAPALATRASAEPKSGSGGGAGDDPSPGSIRIRTDRLDRLIEMVGELVIAQSMVQQDEGFGSTHAEELLRKVAHAGKIVRELQDLSLTMRMVPIRPTIQRLARAVRDISRVTGRPCDFAADGDETEIDRNLVDAIADPLIHMVRNAVDHGIEPPEERERLGKPRAGRVHLSAYHAGGNVVVELRDDGRGLDRARILRKAIARGLAAPDQLLSDADVLGLLFQPGFSTAETITDLSGRGVGMDVVRQAVEALRGRVELASEPGQGTTFTLRLPLTLAITDGMVVRVGSERYVVPTINIHMNFQPRADQLSSVAGRGEIVLLRDEPMSIFRLNHLFGVVGAVDDPRRGLLVVLDDGERRCALLVDELLGQQQVVAKSLGRYVGKVDGLAGGAILGDGRVGLILDPVDLIGLARRLPSARNGHHRERSGLVTNGSSPGGGRASPERRTPGGKFLTFFLADEEYGLEILKVQEIIGLLPITRVPRTPSFIRGVVNLRGKVIPVTDLRLKLGMGPIEATTETCVVIVRAGGLEVGLIVDRVSEVVDLSDSEVGPAPSFGADVDTDYLLGVGKADGRVRLLLDIDRVLSTQDVVDIHSAAVAVTQA